MHSQNSLFFVLHFPQYSTIPFVYIKPPYLPDESTIVQILMYPDYEN